MSLLPLLLVLGPAVLLAARARPRHAENEDARGGSPYRVPPSRGREEGAAPPAPEATRRKRLAVAIAMAAALAPLSPAWLLPVLHDTVAVAPPVSPAPSAGCDGQPGIGGGAEVGIAIALVLVYLAIRFGPALLAGRWAHAWAAHLEIGAAGARLWRVARTAAAVSLSIAALRIAIGGTESEAAFTVYGAITPEGARGGVAEAVVARRLAPGEALRPLAAGEAYDSDLRYISGGSHCFPLFASGPHERHGIYALINGDPVVIDVPESGVPTVHASPSRAPDFPAERRAHFEAAPRWGRAQNGGYVLVERRGDGSIFALEMTEYGARPAPIAAVGPLLQPPVWPVLLVIGAWAIGRRRRGLARFAGAWILIEAVAAMAIAWVGYV